MAPTLYKLYLEETREHVATLQARLGLEEVPGNAVIRAAHTTASISAATGFMAISTLARALEDALGRLSLLEAAPSEGQRFVFARCAGALEGCWRVAERACGEEAALAVESLRWRRPPSPLFRNSAAEAARPAAEEPVDRPSRKFGSADRRAARMKTRSMRRYCRCSSRKART